MVLFRTEGKEEHDCHDEGFDGYEEGGDHDADVAVGPCWGDFDGLFGEEDFDDFLLISLVSALVEVCP